MARVIALFCFVFAFGWAQCEEDPEADFRKLPKLFHLDDYEHCLARSDGIYCLGEFEIYSNVEPNPLYDLIQEMFAPHRPLVVYCGSPCIRAQQTPVASRNFQILWAEKTQDRSLYSRSLLHRGYCIPTRCPSNEVNETSRFETCVDQWAQARSLRTRLRTFHYCRAHGQPRPREPDTNDLPHRAFLSFTYTMLSLAVVGTVYDYCFAKKGNKNPFLMAFSLRINCSQLLSNYQNVDPRLRDLEVFHALRFGLGFSSVFFHVVILTSATYQYNPRFFEKFLDTPSGYSYGQGMVVTLIYIVMANFLMAYNMLLMSNKMKFSLKLFPLLFIKRVIRMYPVYMFLNAFAATWWKSFGDGPMWPVLLANESDVCRKKFWVTAFFLQNFINKKELCLVQTWILAVDIQLHLLTLFLTLVLMKNRQHAVKVLSALIAVSIAVLAHQAFEKELVPAYTYVKPQILSDLFIGADSFFDLYIHPMNGLIPALVGVMLAFLHKDHQERGINMNNSKILVFLHYMALPMIFAFEYSAYPFFRHFSQTGQHIMVVVERIVAMIIAGFVIYSFIYVKSFWHKISSARVLRTVTRLSLSMSMSHWCINILLLTDRWTLHQSSNLQITVDTIAVLVLAHLAAVPLTLLIEYPMQKFLERIINRTGQRWYAGLKAKSTS